MPDRAGGDTVANMKKQLAKWLGVDRQSPYVRNYFYAANMRASIYMSIVIIVLEVWMIIRMTRKIFREHLQSKFWHLVDSYYANYLILLSAGLLMLTMAVRFVSGRQRVRWLGLIAPVLSAPVCVFEVWMISKYNPDKISRYELQN